MHPSVVVKDLLAFSLVVVVVGCGASLDPDPSRGGTTDHARAEANDAPSGSADSSTDAATTPPDSGACDKTINCNDGVCSCGSGANSGKACSKDTGECDRLCSVC